MDMHTHCEYSFDSQTTIEAQARAIKAAGLDIVCATDHDTIEGALRLREVANDFRVVVGEEIATREGELIGLFLEQAVRPGLSAEETILTIREQGGIVSIPHPFSRKRPNRIGREALDRLWPLVDCIEVFNARDLSGGNNNQAVDYARQRNIPGAVGSDAHDASDIGRAWIEIDDFGRPNDFVTALTRGVVHGHRKGATSHVFTGYYALRRWAGRERTSD